MFNFRFTFYGDQVLAGDWQDGITLDAFLNCCEMAARGGVAFKVEFR